MAWTSNRPFPDRTRGTEAGLEGAAVRWRGAATVSVPYGSTTWTSSTPETGALSVTDFGSSPKKTLPTIPVVTVTLNWTAAAGCARSARGPQGPTTNSQAANRRMLHHDGLPACEVD